MWLFVKRNLINFIKMIKLKLQFSHYRVKNLGRYWMSSNFSRGFVLFLKELLQEFDVLIGHICYGITVGAIEVDEPSLWDYSCGLGLDGLEVALAEPAVDRIVSVARDGDDLWDGKFIGYMFKFLFEPMSEL